MAKDSLSLWGSVTFQTLNLFFSSNKFLLPLIKPLMLALFVLIRLSKHSFILTFVTSRVSKLQPSSRVHMT